MTSNIDALEDHVAGTLEREFNGAIGEVQKVFNTMRVVARANEGLREKLEASNASRARLLKIREAINSLPDRVETPEEAARATEDYYAVRRLAAAEPEIEIEHLLRDLQWALDKLLDCDVDGETVARIHIMADRFSLPLTIPVGALKSHQDAGLT